MKDDVIKSPKAQESSNSAKKKKKVGRKIIIRKESQDIRLPNLSRIFFKICEILLSIFLHQLLSQYQEYFSFLFISRKLIASLKESQLQEI